MSSRSLIVPSPLGFVSGTIIACVSVGNVERHTNHWTPGYWKTPHIPVHEAYWKGLNLWRCICLWASFCTIWRQGLSLSWNSGEMFTLLPHAFRSA